MDLGHLPTTSADKAMRPDWIVAASGLTPLIKTAPQNSEALLLYGFRFAEKQTVALLERLCDA